MAKATAKKPVSESTAKGNNSSLRKPQVRILAALAKHGSLSRQGISEQAEVDYASTPTYLGKLDLANRKASDKKCVSLITLDYITFSDVEDKDTGHTVTEFKITAKGKTALKAATK